MEYAVIKIGSKQFKVSTGDVFEMERQNNLKVDVLMHSDGKNISVGQPIVEDVTVKASILENKLDKKIRVARFKSKSRYRKVKGHRQPISVIKIDFITKKGAKKASEAKATTAKPAPKATKTTTAAAKTAKKAETKASTKVKKETK